MRAAVGNGVVAFAGIVGAVCGDNADLNLRRDLVWQVGQHRRISDVAPGDLDASDLQRFLVEPEVDLAQDAAFGATMLAGAPFAFALDLYPGAVRCPTGHHEVMSREGSEAQRTLGATIWDADGDVLLAAAQRAEIGHRPVEADKPQQAFDEAGRQPQRHAEQNPDR